MEKQKQKFYRTKWILWIWLIIFPPIGLILLWVYHKGMKKKSRIILTAVFVIWFAILRIAINGDAPTTPPEDTNPSSATSAVEAVENTETAQEIRTAISLGGDSDTIAAITGAIAEAYYGVPPAMKEEALTYLDKELRTIYNAWAAFATSNEQRFKVLTKYIEKIDAAVSFGEWIIDRENDGTPEHPLQWPFVEYGELIDSFAEDFYQFSAVYPEYKLTDYHQILEKNGLKWEMKNICAAQVENLDAQGALALIMGAIRAERFSDGVLLTFFKDGYITKWLKRLHEIDTQHIKSA